MVDGGRGRVRVRGRCYPPFQACSSECMRVWVRGGKVRMNGGGGGTKLSNTTALTHHMAWHMAHDTHTHGVDTDDDSFRFSLELMEDDPATAEAADQGAVVLRKRFRVSLRFRGGSEGRRDGGGG